MNRHLPLLYFPISLHSWWIKCSDKLLSQSILFKKLPINFLNFAQKHSFFVRTDFFHLSILTSHFSWPTHPPSNPFNEPTKPIHLESQWCLTLLTLLFKVYESKLHYIVTIIFQLKYNRSIYLMNITFFLSGWVFEIRNPFGQVFLTHPPT